jgi:3-oxoacyl-[acyl-carrier protein] reductase
VNIDFKNKTVFISGGTRGIGLECVKKFSKYGANIITFSRDQKKINSTKKLLKKNKINHIVEKGNVLDDHFLSYFSKKCLKKFKRIDIIIHNVGGGGRWGPSDFGKSEFQTWEDVYNKNNRGLIFFTKLFLPKMFKNKWGRIIAISSINGKEIMANDRPWFNAAKSAQNSIIKSFSKKYYVKKNITFNSVSPGPIMIKGTGWDDLKKKFPEKFKRFVKDHIPMNKMGKPEDVANVCVFLCSDYANYLNGINILVDGGMSSQI